MHCGSSSGESSSARVVEVLFSVERTASPNEDIHSVVNTEEAEVVFYTLSPMIGLMKNTPSRLLKFIVGTKAELKLSPKAGAHQDAFTGSLSLPFWFSVRSRRQKLASL